MRKIYLLFILSIAVSSMQAQDDLMSLLEEDESITTEAIAAFKSTRLINGQTTEMRKSGVLDVIISHRFGELNGGYDSFYGLDNAQIRLGVDYGVTDRFNIGIGRSSENKVVDSFMKYKVLSQSTGAKSMPFTLVALVNMSIKTGSGAFSIDNTDKDFADRLAYAYQLHLSRKFNSNFTMQLSPSLIHRNLVLTPDDPNDILAMGFSGRYKITRRLTINAEWFPQLTDHASEFKDSFSLGLDIETGGHVFQLHITNSRDMIAQGHITETTGLWGEGDIHFGFNISRVFDISHR